MTTPATPRRDRGGWDTHWAEFAASHAKNPAEHLRQRLITDALALGDAGEPLRVLELGCGTGELAARIARVRPDAELVGLDGSGTACRIAAARVPTGRFLRVDLSEPLSLPDELLGFATRAVCSEVLEHLDDPGALLRCSMPFLAPGGRLVVTVPAGPRSAFDVHIGHRRHFDRGRLEGLLEGAGYRDVVVRGVGFPFFNLYRLAVVARGERLVTDAARDRDGGELPWLARATLGVFSRLFHANLDALDLGWQLVATAHRP